MHDARRLSGTLANLTPRVVCGVPLDPRLADIWSLCSTMVCMLQGGLPWTAITKEGQFRQITNCEASIECRDTALNTLLRRMITPEERRITSSELMRQGAIFAEDPEHCMADPTLRCTICRSICQSRARVKRHALSLEHGTDLPLLFDPPE